MANKALSHFAGYRKLKICIISKLHGFFFYLPAEHFESVYVHLCWIRKLAQQKENAQKGVCLRRHTAR